MQLVSTLNWVLSRSFGTSTISKFPNFRCHSTNPYKYGKAKTTLTFEFERSSFIQNKTSSKLKFVKNNSFYTLNFTSNFSWMTFLFRWKPLKKIVSKIKSENSFNLSSIEQPYLSKNKILKTLNVSTKRERRFFLPPTSNF